jgi:hypothetical protein
VMALSPSCKLSSRSGTMRNGIVFRLTPLVPLRRGIESGLWPTPCNREAGLSGGAGARRKLDKIVGPKERMRMCSSGLNPLWLEWLMGYPMQHTDCADLETP